MKREALIDDLVRILQDISTVYESGYIITAEEIIDELISQGLLADEYQWTPTEGE